MLKANLLRAKEMLEKHELDSNLYMRIYSFATENVSGYMNLFDFEDKSLLTVGSSGDQILNSYLEGARDITLIDINPFAKYYINLKIAAIISLTYQEFQTFFFKYINNKMNNNRYNMHLFNKLSLNLKSIDYDSYYFFLNIFKNYKMDNISDYFMNDDQSNSKVIKTINNYLQDFLKFDKLKAILKDVSFKFINEDIFKFNRDIQYDNILLSNLCTTVTLYEFKELLTKLKHNNLKIDGRILIVYLWNMDFFSNSINFDWKQVYLMPATRYLLRNFISEHYNITGIDDILYDKDSKSDLIMIYKK